MRKALEWFGGSVLVYICVAACSAGGGPAEVIDDLMGGGDSMSSGASSNGASNSQDTGGGTSITDPVPDADAAEDGTRIVNIYRTTADGLKTHEGYWDTKLNVGCTFQRLEDGKEYCYPKVENSALYFADSACSKPLAAVYCAFSYQGAPATVAVPSGSKGSCPNTPYAAIFKVGAKVTPSTVYQGELNGSCSEQASVVSTYTFYETTGQIALDDLAEGFTEHE